MIEWLGVMFQVLLIIIAVIVIVLLFYVVLRVASFAILKSFKHVFGARASFFLNKEP